MRCPLAIGVVLLVVLGTTACRHSSDDNAPASGAAGRTTRPADVAASTTSPVDFFHEALVANGDDVQTAFGSDLATLGLNPRDLLQDDPKHAYDVTMEKVSDLGDPAARREMTQTLFNSTTTP